MKRKLIALAIILIALAPFTLHAQYNFSLGELQKLTGKNPSDFETFVLGKDYSLQSKLSNNVTKVYISDKKGDNGTQNTISRYQVPNAMARITFTTTDKKYYLDIKTHLAASGLKFVNEENKTIDGAQAECNNYANGALKLSLCSYTTSVTWFKIEVHF
jgi:hypothetical protein